MGFKPKTSTKHAYFVVNETMQMYKRSKVQCYVACLDAKKAYDKEWRDGMFYKLIDKTSETVWRALYRYYEDTNKINNVKSDEFDIEQGVKQGGVLSPDLFNFYINDLIEECLQQNIGAKIGQLNVSVIAYADEIILISPNKNHLERLLKTCDDFAAKWKMEFNPDKSTVMCFNGLNDHDFYINNGIIKKVDSCIYLGLPLGSSSFTREFWMNKMKKVERSLFSLNSIGCQPGTIRPINFGFIYKQFVQSIFVYGLEVSYINQSDLQSFDRSQAKLIKHFIGISKFCRNTPLLNAMRVQSISHLYYKFKTLFMCQIKDNELANKVYLEIGKHNPIHDKYSYFSQIHETKNRIENNCGHTVDMISTKTEDLLKMLTRTFMFEHQGLIDSVKMVLFEFEKPDADPEWLLKLLRSLLYVEFYQE
jgi:hypothetical protein